MTKSDPEAHRKSSLSDCTRLENEFGSFNLEILKFLMHFREPENSLYFIFYILTFFFLIYIFCFSFFLFLIKNFYLLPRNSKIALYLPPPASLDVCLSSGKEVTEIR
jgi:4-amino-4-deoxy-L-arabinose transferase-like glycosyltransferase